LIDLGADPHSHDATGKRESSDIELDVEVPDPVGSEPQSVAGSNDICQVGGTVSPVQEGEIARKCQQVGRGKYLMDRDTGRLVALGVKLGHNRSVEVVEVGSGEGGVR
jgi:hypothetical protein